MTQGSIPRPRTQKKCEAKAKYRLSENRPSRGQGQECSRPRTKDTTRKKKRLRAKKKSKTFAKFQAFSKKMSSQILHEVSGILQEEEKKRS